MKKQYSAYWAAGMVTGLSVLPWLSARAQEKKTAQKMACWEEEGAPHRAAIFREDEVLINGVYKSPVDQLPLAFTILKAENPEGLVQIVHGAQEHKGYYMAFARRLRSEGFTVLLSDNRGHGDSTTEAHPRAYISSIDDVVADQYALARFFKERYPGLSLAMFGHSFGSLIARNFIMEHDDMIDKLLLTGLVCYPPLARVGLFLGRMENFYTSPKRRGTLIRLADAKTKAKPDTISNNPDFLRSFEADEKLVKHYLNGGASAIWDSAARLKEYRRYRVKNPALKILALNGTEDPLTGGAKGLADTAKTFYKLGYEDYENRIYPRMKHDLLHENAGEWVIGDMVKFLKK
ncbi:MAG: alpha/beta fold hydrolase [Peptoniphilus sp.]|nr:alpha/beta fold hydrolase [Peptoniphilus sp.]MDY3118394.1 alpha/beta fold hydrolase [Peptoniphilus sp.]